ncbi:Pseudouridine synthase I TruA [Penicillium cf. griseofulvum]|uniref:Pseudouridine synthase I TruA n=1 Tax=Penicillium cf. griseofulvum TaxID=2972120 RepID=A0A9W9N1X8_9EURO|nr:Pseudouridine synthase I TruA [Penicillium cf. griseofulvum]KAJ5422659.1 Pseudouridine synthase I TruA [Penicillium cf. griseofulvum]KAJ5428836.1 Pseudouridine synthase I TruA [Penicillium cf. griseofulvum]
MADTNRREQPDYSAWSNSSLIARITELERQLHSQTTEFTAPTEEPSQTPCSSSAPISADVHEPAVPLTESFNTSKKRPHSPPDSDTTPAPAPPTRFIKVPKPPKVDRSFDPSKYTTRFIALKFAYLGQEYNGLEHTNGNTTPLPTVEEILWKALKRTRLISPETTSDLEPPERTARVPMRPYHLYWDGCDYSKAGRTDKGVSAFGQVIGLRVRSQRPMPKTPTEGEDAMNVDSESTEKEWDDVADEMNYINVLNRVLPEDIRVLAWCPNPPPGFDARFSCRERRYKYFFTNPAFSPTPGPIGFQNRANNGNGPRAEFREGWLDIEAMREAAKHFEGLHDFRNFCKLDTNKQIDNFERIIHHSSIEAVNPKVSPVGYVGQPGFQAKEGCVPDSDVATPNTVSQNIPQVYSFNLHGSAFLWHQVRHMVAILFLVGQGLESPSIVPELLDVAKNPRKPTYAMADDAPLVLWDCIFPDLKSGSRADSLNWIYAGDNPPNCKGSAKGDSKFGMRGTVERMWTVWRKRKIDEILAGALLDLTASQGNQDVEDIDNQWLNAGYSKRSNRGAKIWYGGNDTVVGGKYTRVDDKSKMETVEVQNAKGLVVKQRRLAKGEAAKAALQE